MGLTTHSREHTWRSIRLREQKGAAFLQIWRPDAANSINATLLQEMKMALEQLEEKKDIKVVVLEGTPEHFCTGMDFEAVSKGSSDALAAENPAAYYDLVQYLSACSKIIVSKVEGKVNAGGVGLVAVSDLVIAHEQATFGLSEALFGLLPACVLPFLIRRVGYQKAKWMTLITQGIPAARAYQIGLADEVCANVNESLRRNLLRLTRLDTDTIRELKDYMSGLWIIDEQTRRLAVEKFSSMMDSEKVQENIKNFVQLGKFPWE